MCSTPQVRSGLSLLRDRGFDLLRGQRVGLVTHDAAVDECLRSAAELFQDAVGFQLAALFGPEHGLHATAQDLIPVGANCPFASGVPVHSLYGETFASLKPNAEQLIGLDTLAIDLQDVGSRYYTFQATMLLCLEAASELGLRVAVLDRPNPLGGDLVEGPGLLPGYESFVGLHPIAVRHGMTLGELARLYHAERQLTCPLEVIPCTGWRRSMPFEETGLPWVLPSPNMPTLETAWVYPGQCLLEGTNLSEGRGTTRPFELCGAPQVEASQVAKQLREWALPGIAFRPAWFVPTFQKHAGKLCGGVQLHVTDRGTFQPVRTGLAVLAALREASRECFDWRREPYEFVHDRLAIDLLFGSSRERLGLESGLDLSSLTAAWSDEEAAFRKRRSPFLLYD